MFVGGDICDILITDICEMRNFLSMKNIKIINLRALAIILVVFGHSIIIYSDSWTTYLTNINAPFLNCLKKVINLIQMPLYFAISGYLFKFGIGQKLSELILKKGKRLLLPFFIVGMAWLIPIRVLIEYPQYKECSVFEIVIYKFLLGTDNGHLWFLPTLFLIFVSMFLLLSFLSKLRSIIKHSECYFDLGAAMLLLLLSMIAYNHSRFTYLIWGGTYAFWFYFGYLLKKYETEFNKLNKKYRSRIVILLFISILSAIRFNHILLIYFCSVLWVISLFMIIPNETNKVIQNIEKNSFGIYLFHSPLVYITYTYLANASPLLVIVINFFCFGIVSLCITCILRKTNLKFVIGE